MVAVSALLSIACATVPNAPQQTVEAEIRRLDRAEAEALLRKDSMALRKLWAPDFTVNNPRNEISRGSEGVIALMRSGIVDYSSFDRHIEAVLVHGSTVVVMGGERLTPAGNSPLAGREVRRRFTHIWMKRNGAWRLTARHANTVAPQ